MKNKGMISTLKKWIVFPIAALLMLMLSTAMADTGVTTRPFGEIGGKAVTAYTIENKNGMRLTVIDYGARIASILLPDGREAVLGFDDAEGYGKDTASLGAVCGRYANRIGGASFILNGERYELDANDGDNTLHGGSAPFSSRFYKANVMGNAVVLNIISPDGDGGFPGELTLDVRYTLTEDDTVRIEYYAETTRDTMLNLTNHTYFNLMGGGSVFDHKLAVNAGFYLPVDDSLVPTGEIFSVDGKVFDLREDVRLGDRLDPVDSLLVKAKGYDTCYLLDRMERGTLEYAATLTAPDGMMMDCYTTELSVQVYTANNLNEPNGRGGQSYGPYSAVCLETQTFPDATSYTFFPSPILKAGQTFYSETEYRFHK